MEDPLKSDSIAEQMILDRYHINSDKIKSLGLEASENNRIWNLKYGCVS